jgi:hypothetical protein
LLQAQLLQQVAVAVVFERGDVAVGVLDLGGLVVGGEVGEGDRAAGGVGDLRDVAAGVIGVLGEVAFRVALGNAVVDVVGGRGVVAVGVGGAGLFDDLAGVAVGVEEEAARLAALVDLISWQLPRNCNSPMPLNCRLGLRSYRS